MLIITTGNTGRRIIIPKNQRCSHKSWIFTMSTWAWMDIGAWRFIWRAEDIITVEHPFINIWIIKLFSVVRPKKPDYGHGKPQLHKVFENKLHQDFTAEKPNQKWCTDFTYLFLKNHGVRYNCTILDLYDRSVIASTLDRNIASELAIRTLKKRWNHSRLSKSEWSCIPIRGHSIRRKHLPNFVNLKMWRKAWAGQVIHMTMHQWSDTLTRWKASVQIYMNLQRKNRSIRKWRNLHTLTTIMYDHTPSMDIGPRSRPECSVTDLWYF